MNSSDHCYFRKIASGLCAALFLCAAAGVSAQTVHKQVDSEGRTTYTDRPEASASASTAAVPALEVTKAPARISIISSRRAATIDANEAARRLGQAQLKRKQGFNPLPGEQIHAIGSSALNHRYWRRQEKLRIVVEEAQRRLNETGGAQLAQR